MPESPVPIPELLTEVLVRRHYLPIGARTLARWQTNGQFPPPDFRIGHKARYWRKTTIEAWIAAQVEQTKAG